MLPLSPSALIERAPELSVRLTGTEAILEADGLQRPGGPHALAILDAFSKPCTLQAGLQRLQSHVRGAEDWRRLVATVLSLHEAGILQESGSPQRAGTRGTGTTAPATHIRMLNDRARVEAYLQAIRATITADDVVLDIGTGTGVLAVAAAQAGARHVFAVEASPMAAAAEAVFAANGVAERITLVRGWSTEIDLPERANVLVAEILGNDPLAERVLATTRDAQRRLLASNARLIPSHLTIFAQAIQLPEAIKARCTFQQATVDGWRELYGIDFSPLLREAVARPAALPVDPQEARDWVPGSPTVVLVEIDLTQPDAVPSRTSTIAVSPAECSIEGVLVSFALTLAPGITLSTQPSAAAVENHWQCMVWLLPEPLQVPRGAELEFEYRLSGQDRGRASVRLR